MNEIVNKFLLVRDKSIPKMHLRQSRFTCSACGPFTINKERIKKFKETGDLGYIYRNGLHKVCFQHDIPYRDFKDLNRLFADKVLCNKAFNIAKDLKYAGYQWGLNQLGSVVCNFFDKKTSGSAIKNVSN